MLTHSNTQKTSDVEKRKSQHSLMCLGWIDVIALTVCSCFFTFHFLPHTAIGKGALAYIDYLLKAMPLLEYGSLVVIILVLVIYILHKAGCLQDKYSFNALKRQPSFLLAVFFVCGIELMLYTYELCNCLALVDNATAYKFNITTMVIVAKIVTYNLFSGIFSMMIFVLAYILCIYMLIQIFNYTPTVIEHFIYNKKHDDITPTPSLLPYCGNGYVFSKDDIEYLDWISTDSPIKSLKDDQLNHSPIAVRIATRMCEGIGTSVCLLGAYGSGKTSILRMVENMLKHKEDHQLSKNNDNREHIVCWIHGWGYAKDALLEGIMSQALGQLRKYFDCYSVISLPHALWKSFESTGSWWGWVMSYMAGIDREKRLEKLDDLLESCNVRLTLFLEDFDRNSENGVMPINALALLDKLKLMSNVGFVLSLGQEQINADKYVKVCAHYEALAAPHKYMMDKMIKFYEIMKKCYGNDICERNTSYVPDGYWEINFNNVNVIDSIGKVVKSLRLLKHIMRNTVVMWQKLHGELCFDDLLIANTIKIISPDAFGFIVYNIELFRKDNKIEELHSKFIDLIDIDNRDSIWELICAITCRGGKVTDADSMRPSLNQNFATVGATDYWRRYVVGCIDVNELSDQVFLHFFREHRKYLICYDVTNLNKTNDFFRKLDEDEGYRSKFMQFFEFFYIDNEHVLSLMHFFLSYCGRCSAKQVEELRCNFDFIYKYAHNSLGLVRGYNYDISDVFKENVFSASLFFYVASPESQHNATGMLVNSLNTAFGNHSMDFIAALREDCKKSLLLFFHLLAKYGVNVRKLPWLLDVVIDATGLNDSMDLFTILFPKFIENFEQGSMPVECDKGNDKFGNTLLCAIYVLFPDVTAKKPRYKMLLQSIACLQAGDYDHSIDASYRQRWSVIYNQIKAEAIEGLHEGKLNGDIENL